jgi:hypothetical protein
MAIFGCSVLDITGVYTILKKDDRYYLAELAGY